MVGSVAVAHEVAADSAGTVAVNRSSDTTWNDGDATEPNSTPVAALNPDPYTVTVVPPELTPPVGPTVETEGTVPVPVPDGFA